MTTRELNGLIRHFKKLVEADVQGITATDARGVVADWLEEYEGIGSALHFQEKILNYQFSPKIKKMTERYENNQ